jgi:hypothetical protein
MSNDKVSLGLAQLLVRRMKSLGETAQIRVVK